MKFTIGSIIIAVAFLGGAYLYTNRPISAEQVVLPAGAGNVTLEGGRQIVEIRARGGYIPRTSVAKAGIPTVVRFDTNGTYDCSISVRIPSLSIRKILPSNGNTDIDVGSPEAGILRGSCSMGMYPFEIDFRS